MKRIKNLVALFTVAAILFMLPNSTLTASAEEPVTFVVKYMEGEWRFQAYSDGTYTFDESAEDGPFENLRSIITDGSVVVIHNNATTSETLDFGDVNLSNLTVTASDGAGFLVIYAKSITDFYAHAGTASSINATVTNASVYDSAVCNFNGNVGELTLYCTDEPTSTLGCGGTLGHFYAPSTTEDVVYYNFYNFTSNFVLSGGSFQTPDEYYSLEAPAATPAPATPAPQQPTGGASDYDDVPKTGDSNLALWFLGTAVVAAIASISLGKKSR